MPKYIVRCKMALRVWRYCDIEVEAESSDAAIEIAEEMDLPDGPWVDDDSDVMDTSFVLPGD